ncbi:MAG: hypothetical protein ACKOYJ_00195 [Planctomycetia bacterium]
MASALRLCIAAFASAAACAALAAVPTDDEIAALVRQLGDPDYARREIAAAKLETIATDAIDHLLAAAERSDDLEVSLRAGWLVETIPLDTPADSAEVASLLEGYTAKSLAERIVIMHRLLRLDDDAGIAALARIIRLGRDPTGARVAAAILVREWSPGDPAWPVIVGHMGRGLGESRRLPARLLTSLIDFSHAESVDGRLRALEAARELVALLDRQRPEDDRRGKGRDTPVEDEAASPDSGLLTRDLGRTTQRIFERCLVQMLVEAGRHDEAAAILRATLAESLGLPDDDPTKLALIADTLVWSASHGVPEVVGGMPAEASEIVSKPMIRYAMAVCERAREQETEAERLARGAFEAGNGDAIARQRAGILLVRWGAGDWACREYEAVVNDDSFPATQLIDASILYSEFLHDRGRDGEAAGVLRALVLGEHRLRNDVLRQMGRDPDATAARMFYFEACDAAARGDAEGERKALEKATRIPRGKDVDALITLYRSSEASPEARAIAVARINEALEHMEARIKEMPDEPNAYNEYAWLVANTEGDMAKALRYSKRTLRDWFDNASYLDTLAHCHAATGNIAAAVRTQRLALRQEPNTRMIRVNLERFERRAAAATSE